VLASREEVRQEGVELVGRLAGIRDGKAIFSGSLRNVCTLTDLKMNRLLDTFDAWAGQSGVARQVAAPQRCADTDVGPAPRLAVQLGREIRTIVWATGFRPDFSWLSASVFDRAGRLLHDRGVVAGPGLYVLGLPFMRRRKSSFIHGAQDDVEELAEHLLGQLRCNAPVMSAHWALGLSACVWPGGESGSLWLGCCASVRSIGHEPQVGQLIDDLQVGLVK
jgi:putative flavoprotein involved in K+ transport